MNAVMFSEKHNCIVLKNKNHGFEMPWRQHIFLGFFCFLFLYVLQRFAVFSTSFPGPTLFISFMIHVLNLRKTLNRKVDNFLPRVDNGL